jgi:hypothetical protein
MAVLYPGARVLGPELPQTELTHRCYLQRARLAVGLPEPFTLLEVIVVMDLDPTYQPYRATAERPPAPQGLTVLTLLHGRQAQWQQAAGAVLEILAARAARVDRAGSLGLAAGVAAREQPSAGQAVQAAQAVSWLSGIDI